jgi:hypothetical protein
MKFPRLTSVIAGLTLAPLLVVASLSATEDRPSQNDAASTESFTALQKEKPKAGPKKPRGRLPNYYNAAGVTNKQRLEIYKIQSTYREKIEELEKQLLELKEKMDEEVEAVLTEEQKKKVEELRTAAAKKRKARAKAKKKATEEE